jgi:hypothetical protein
MDEALETLAYAVRNKFRGLYASGLISKPERERGHLNGKRPSVEFKKAAAHKAMKAISEGQTLEAVSYEMELLSKTLRTWLVKYAGYQSKRKSPVKCQPTK